MGERGKIKPVGRVALGDSQEAAWKALMVTRLHAEQEK